VDVDHEIEARTGVRIPLIFEYEGEAGFRAREAQALKQLSEAAPMVIATGGGAVLREENRAVMRATGMTIYLCVSPELLHERTRHDQNRPLLQVADPLAKLQSLFAERDPYYRELANLMVHGGTGHASELVRQIEKELGSRCAA
jgi:shikimate kinase